MRLVKMPATNLQPGMFVAKLDRPWLDTPFTLKGFVVRNSGEVPYISRYVDHVMVDVEFQGIPHFLSLVNESIASRNNADLHLKIDYQAAQRLIDDAVAQLAILQSAIGVDSDFDMTDLQAALAQLIEAVFANQDAVAAALRCKLGKNYRLEHSIAMAVWAAILGRHLGLDNGELNKLTLGCALCDINMAEPLPRFLDGQMKLKDEHHASIESHPMTSSHLIANLRDIDSEIVSMIESHHERLNGSGYPRALAGVGIPLFARIAGLVDTYDAMISERRHIAARTSHEAAQELIDAEGVLFQGVLVEQFVQAIGLFPTGSLVELNTGEAAIVVRQNSTRRLKPEIMLVRSAQKHEKAVPELVELANQTGAGEDERWIKHALAEGAFGLKSETYFS